MKEYHILNLGAGVQSTMLYMLAAQRHEVMPKIDCAIFADTGEEPQAVYDHLEWLKTIGGPEILTVSTGQRLGDAIMSNKRHSSIPLFSKGGSGLGMRQCTFDYKVVPINKAIRDDVCELKFRQQFPKKDIHVHQYMGLSFDEARRVLRVNKRYYDIPWSTPHFPLFETNTTRGGAIQWLASKVPHETPRSACSFCPYHDKEEWRSVKASDADWGRACLIDDWIRTPEYMTAHKYKHEPFLHRSCVPLRDVDFSASPDTTEHSKGESCRR